jgi:hypothetical protein
MKILLLLTVSAASAAIVVYEAEAPPYADRPTINRPLVESLLTSQPTPNIVLAAWDTREFWERKERESGN